MRVITLAAMLLLAAAPAFAQSAPEITTETIMGAVSGRSVDWLANIFGEPFGGGQTGIGKIIGVFNAAMLAAGAMFLGYTVWSGTLQTAHEGQLFGKRYSSLWMPIRLPMAMAAMIPTASGFNGIQHITAAVALAGVGLANLGHTYFMESVLGTSTQAPIPLVRPQAPVLESSTIKSIMQIYACTVAVNTTTTWATGGDFTQAAAGPIKTVESGQTVIRFGGINNSGVGRDACGSIRFPKVDAGQYGDAANGIMQAHARALESITQAAAAPAAAIAKQVALSKSDEALNLPDGRAMITQILQSYKTAYAEIVQASGGVRSKLNTQLRDQLTNADWTSAGAFYRTISEANQVVSGMAMATPTVQGPGQVPVSAQAAYQRISVALDSWFDRHASSVNTRDMALSSSATMANGDLGGVLAQVYDPARWQWAYDLFSPGTSGGSSAGNSGEAMANIVGLGNGLRVATAGVAGAYLLAGSVAAGAEAVATNASNQPLVGAAAAVVSGPLKAIVWLINQIGPYLFILIVTIYSAAALMTFVIPMMPYIMWVMGVVGWLMLVAEAIVAGPVWAFGHLRADGDGFAGATGHTGYMITLQIFLRPILMGVGLLLAMAVFSQMALFVQDTFYPAMRSALGNTYGFVDGLIINLCIMVGLYITLAYKSFSMIHQVPDRIMRWAGGNGESLNEEQHAGEVKGIGVAAIANVKSGAMRGAQTMRKPGGGAPKGGGDDASAGPGGSDAAQGQMRAGMPPTSASELGSQQRNSGGGGRGNDNMRSAPSRSHT